MQFYDWIPAVGSRVTVKPSAYGSDAWSGPAIVIAFTRSEVLVHFPSGQEVWFVTESRIAREEA